MKRTEIEIFINTWERDWWEYLEDGRNRGVHRLPKEDLINRLEDVIGKEIKVAQSAKPKPKARRTTAKKPTKARARTKTDS